MADSLVSDIEGANNAFSKMDKLLSKLTESAAKFGTAVTKGMAGVGNGGFGARGLGVGSNNVMSGSFGNMPPMSSSVNGMLGGARLANFGYSAAAGGLQAVTSLVGGAFNAMPDVATTTARSSAFYGASVMAGLGPNGRNRLALGTFGAMKGGISAAGYDSVTAANLVGMGVMPTFNKQGQATGQFANLATATANAAKYLNIDNATAAQALGGLTQGSTSSALMRNFAIWTTDPTTGRRLKPTEIFEQMNQRVTGGQKLTRAELMTSLQGGSFGNILENSGLEGAQKDLARQYILDKASGKTMSLEDNTKMNKLFEQAGINPEQAKYDIATSQTATMQAASDAYIKGMQTAAGVIDKFNTAMQGFLKSPAGQAMAQLNAGVNTAMGDNTVSGLGAGVLGALGGAGMMYGAARQNSRMTKALKNAGLGGNGSGAVGAGRGGGKAAALKAKGYTWKPGGKGGGQWVTKAGKPVSKAALAAAEKGAVKGAEQGLLKGVSKGLGRAVPILGTAINAFSIFDDVSKGDWRSVWGDVGGMLGGSAATAAVGAATGGVGLIAGAATYAGGSMAGNWAGTAAYDALFGSGGADSTIASSSSSGSGAPKLVHPVPKGSKVTLGVTSSDKLHPNGHNGIDFGVGIGTVVMAAADGEVIGVGGNGRNTYPGGPRDFGLFIKIVHAGGYTTTYAHLSSQNVSVGAKVSAGQAIGLSGNTGFSTGAHLHFELRNKGGGVVNPAPLLGVAYSDPLIGFGDQSSSDSAGSGASSMLGGAVSGDASNLGFSNGSDSAAKIKYPSSYKGADTSTSAITGGGSTAVANESAIGHGASTTMTGGGSVGNGMGGGPGGGGGGNNVTINLTIAKASESEAKRFAQLVKQYLDDDALISSMGSL